MAAEPDLGPRDLDDVRMLRAVAHPVRVALIEALTLRGALTATEAAELVGESPSACSFHLRRLAAAGFVEEAERGPGRRRPWRMTRIGQTIDTEHPDPETRRAAAAVVAMWRERQLERYRRWTASRGGWPEEWRAAAIDDEHLFWLTPDELAALHAELLDRLIPHLRERLTDPSARPRGAVPVELLLLAYPIPDPA